VPAPGTVVAAPPDETLVGALVGGIAVETTVELAVGTTVEPGVGPLLFPLGAVVLVGRTDVASPEVPVLVAGGSCVGGTDVGGIAVGGTCVGCLVGDTVQTAVGATSCG
jgi:hypothetical protein